MKILFYLLLTVHGLLPTVNAQLNWTQTNGPYGGKLYSLCINPVNGDIFAGTYRGGIYRSTDNGANWTAINTGLTTNTTVRSLAINAGGHLFAGTDGHGVYRSTDNGANWTAINTGLTNTTVRSLAINAGGHLFAGTYGGGVYRSTDNGANWTAINNGLTYSYVQSLAINAGGHLFAGTAGGGVCRSTDNGANWTAINNGLTNTDVWSLAINAGGHLFAGTYGGGVYRSTDNGANWTAINNGLTHTNVWSLAINTGGHLFAGTDSGGVYRSTDNGANWTAINNGLTYSYVQSLAINAGGHLFAGTAGGGVCRSTDNGANWTAINNGLTNTDVWSLAINAGGHLFAGTWGGGVYRSTDNGANWTAINNGLTNTNVLSLAINAGGHLFAGTWGGGVYRSTDNGANWTAINNGLTNIGVWSLAINAGGHLFAGTDGAVFLSTNNGTNWTEVLTATEVTSFAFSGSYIFAGTATRGVLQASMTAPTAPSLLTASGVSLSQVNLSWTASGNNPERYRIFRSTPSNTSYVYHDSTTSTSYSDTRNTTANTVYYYTVYGVNTWGVSPASNEDSAKTLMLAPSFAGNPNLSVATPVPYQTVTVSVTVNGESPTVYLTYGNSKQTTGNTVTMNNSGNVYSHTIPGGDVTTEGLWYRIIAQNEGGTVYYPSATEKVNIPVELENSEISSILNAGGIPQKFPTGKFFTVSLPCSAAMIDLTNRWGAQKKNSMNIPTNWRAGTFNATTQQFSDVTTLVPNTAYVIYTTVTAHPFTTISSGLTNAPGLLDIITLYQGWNLIPWPYAYSMNVTVTNSGEIDPIWYLDDTGWHGNATQFKPFRAYAIRKKTSGTIPLMNVISLSAALEKITAENAGSLRLSVTSGDYYDQDNYIGTHERAMDESDNFDAAEPLDMENGVCLYFSRSGEKLAFDIRSSDEPGHTWDAVLLNHTGQNTATLAWDNAQPLNGWLVDMDNNRFISLTEQNSYTFRSLKNHRFKIIAGDANYVAKEADALKKSMPENFSLYPNYPNPFNPNTTIKFDIAKTGNVKLQVYNILGQLVTTLVNENLETGKYDIQWNGRDARGHTVSSGVYLIRMETAGYVKSRKILLVR